VNCLSDKRGDYGMGSTAPEGREITEIYNAEAAEAAEGTG